MVDSPKNLIDLPKEVIEHLYPGENVFFCIKKILPVELKPRFLAITDRRVIYLDQKILGRYVLKDIPYSKIELVLLEEGLVASKFGIKDEEVSEIGRDRRGIKGAHNWLINWPINRPIMGSSVPGGIQETDITHQIQKIRDINTFELVHAVNQFLTLWAYSYRGPVHEMTPEEGISLPRPARRRIS